MIRSSKETQIGELAWRNITLTLIKVHQVLRTTTIGRTAAERRQLSAYRVGSHYAAWQDVQVAVSALKRGVPVRGSAVSLFPSAPLFLNQPTQPVQTMRLLDARTKKLVEFKTMRSPNTPSSRILGAPTSSRSVISPRRGLFHPTKRSMVVVAKH